MRFNKSLWTIQAALALLFMFAGVVKLVMPIEQMTGPVARPGELLRFIGVAEVLGAVGLVLPGLFSIHRELTPIAAGGLVVIMLGATAMTATASAAAWLFPLIVGVLAAMIVSGRRGWWGQIA